MTTHPTPRPLHTIAILLALALTGCGSVDPLAWSALGGIAAGSVYLGLLAGAWLGTRAEAAKWRSKGADPPNGGGRMLSGGRFYWVCAEDASQGARVFVADELTGIDPKATTAVISVKCSCGHSWQSRQYTRTHCPSCSMENLRVTTSVGTADAGPRGEP